MTNINQLHSIVFMGTGASSSLPNILCITNPNSSCKVCPSSLTKSEASLQFLVPLNIKTIDAVILTHGHADAMFGLDDLRSWSWMKHGGIPVYLSQSTMDVVASAFPYLVDRSKATGGGEVPTLNFNVIDEYEKFTVEGLEFTPINVEHGIQFGCQAYMSLGYRFQNITYLSDVSKIPNEVRKRIEGTQLLVIDCLRELYYSSHYGFHEAMEEVVRYKPLNTYFIGMGHSMDHDELADKCAGVASHLVPGHSVTPAYDGLVLEFQGSNQKRFTARSLN